MPSYDVTAPDGRVFEVNAPEGATQDDILAYAKKEYAKFPIVTPDTGLTGAAKSSTESLKADLYALAGRTGLMDTAEAEKQVKAHSDESKRVFKPTEKGWTEAPLEKAKELFGGSLPYMALPMAAGAAAFLAPEAAIAGGLITTADLAAGAVGVAQFTGSNLSRQMDTGKHLSETNLLAAGAAAIPQAALDVFGFHMIPGVRKIFGQAGLKITDKQAADVAKTGMQSIVGKTLEYGGQAAKTATIEGLNETGQQVLERLQAGLSLTNEEARKEYFENFLGGAVLGSTLAIPGHAIEKMGRPAPEKPSVELQPEQPQGMVQPNLPTSEPVTQAGIAPVSPPPIPTIPKITTTPTGMEVPEAPKPAAPVVPAAPVAAPVTPQATPTGVSAGATSDQNRDRSSPASVAQMQGIAARPMYAFVGPSNTISGSGAPIITGPKGIPDAQKGFRVETKAEDGTNIPAQYAVVEAKDLLPSHNADGSVNKNYGKEYEGLRAVVGNGRTAGLQEAYNKGTAQDYRAAMAKDAGHGIDPKVIEGMKEPVLVRYADPAAIPSNIGDLSNTSGTLNLSALEQAQNDAGRVDLAGLGFDDNGNITPNTIRQFIAAMPTSEQANLIDKDGNPTRQAHDRLNAAIFHKAYGNNDLTTLAHQSEDPEARNILRALSEAAPQMAQIDGAGAYDIRENVAQATQLAVNARRNGIKLEDLVKQQDMTVEPRTMRFLGLFADNPRSPKNIAEALKNLATNIANEVNKPAEGLFGAEPKKPIEQLVFEATKPKKPEADLFTAPPAAEEPNSGPESGTTVNEDLEKVYELPGKSKQAIHNELMKLNTVPQLAEWAVKNAPNPVAKTIAEKVNQRIQDFVKENVRMEFKILDGTARAKNKWSGLTRSGYGQAHILLRGLDSNGLSDRFTGTNYSTVLHELIHAATVIQTNILDRTQKLRFGHQDQAIKELKSLLTKVRKQTKALEMDYTTGKRKDLQDHEYHVLQQSSEMTKDIDELLAWGLTDAKYQKFLSEIKVGKKNGFGVLIDAVRKLLGLNPEYESALDKLMSLTEKLMEPTGQDIYAGIKGKPMGTVTTPEILSYQNKTPDNLTKLGTTPKAGKAIADAARGVFNNIQDDGYRTGLRVAWVDKNSGLAKDLASQPTFDTNGQLRADMLARVQDQMTNLIHTGLQSGTPTVNSDGTLGIDRSENNLARSQVLADKLDGKIFKDGKAMSGRMAVQEIARILRGKDVLAEDKVRNAKGRLQLEQAKSLTKDLKQLQKESEGKLPVKTMREYLNAIKYLRKEGYANKNLKRELQVTPAHIKWAEEQMKNVPEVKEILNIWKNVNDSLVTLWEEIGLFTKEQADEYRSRDNYVPLFKSREDLENGVNGGYGGSGAKSVKAVKKLQGSEAIRNIWENMDRHYASMIAAAYQNQTRKVATNQLKALGAADVVEHDNPDVNLRYRDPTDPHADANGIVSAIVYNPNTLAAFQMMHYELGPIMKAFAASTKVLRAGALVNPMYWIKQLIRDPIHASLVANSGIVTPFHALGDYINILRNDSPEGRILAERGVIGPVDSTVDIHEFLKTAGKERRDPSKLHKFINTVMRMHEASDAATRVSIYKKQFKAAKEKGMTDEQATNFAVHKARESINFAARGNSPTLNAIRHMIPFVSAQITSLDSVYRAMTGSHLSGVEREEAKRAFRNMAMTMTMMSLAYAWMYSGDDDYNKVPDTVKDNNWLIPNPFKEHTFIKIPIPFEVGYLFKTIPEAGARYMMGNSTGREVLKSYGIGLMNNMPGGMISGGAGIPQALKPIVETTTNYSFFTGRPIEGMSDQGKPVEFRGDKASEVARLMSHYGLKNVGLSPAKIDHLIQGYTAELGTFATGMASSAIEAAEGKKPPAKNIEEEPFFKSFMTNPNSSKAVADFYELDHNAGQLYTQFNALKKAGQGEEAKALLSDEQNKKMIAVAPALRKVQTQMTTIHNQINIIKQNTRMSPEEKRDKINMLEQSLDKVARQGYKIAESAGINR
jgi:hypothetical protein